MLIYVLMLLSINSLVFVNCINVVVISEQYLVFVNCINVVIN